jgi:arabinogalactan oligomer/maltooligosaccharide transport system substrate-binding protein
VLDWLGPRKFRLYLPLVVARIHTANSFWADRYWLEPGECTSLHWLLTNIRAAYLDGDGVAEQGTRQVCPASTHTYVLRVMRESGTQDHRLTIVVGGGEHPLVRLWHGWTGAEADTLAEVIHAFQAANPGVTVVSLAVPFDQLRNKFITEASTGGGPDLMIGPKYWIGELAQAGLIASLDDLAPNIGLYQLSKSAVDANKLQGKVWAFPESTEAVVLWYNKDLVKEAPKSEAELLTQAAKVGLAYNSGFYHSAGILLAEGGKVFDDQQKCAFGQGNSVVNGLTFIKNAKGTPNVIMDSDGSKLDAAFKDGKVGFVFNGPWATDDYVEALGADKLGIVDPIAVGAGKFAPFLGTESLFLSANSQSEAAQAFLRFMARPETQAMLTVAGHIPSNPNAEVHDPFIAAFLKQTASASYLPNEPEMGAVWTPAADMITKVIEGRLAPADAVKEACAAIDKANGK